MSLLGLPPLNRNLIRCALAVCVLILNLCPMTIAAEDDATAQWIQIVLDNWREACRTDLRISEKPLPWMIFCDETHAWHISPDLKLLPPHKKLPRTLRFSGREYDVFEVMHDSKIWVPGRDPISVAHKAVTMLQGWHRYPDSVDDNIIQTAFESNSEFQRTYKEELKQLSAAFLASDIARARSGTAEGLQMMDRRRERFFVGEYKGWSEMGDVFLALEGSAMWVQFKSALRLAPKGQPWLDTLAILGQRTDAWTQSEGLGLFLLIDRFSPFWQAKFFREKVPSPIETLRQALASASH